ncbi:MAG: YmdB family metallophosphoesterase [Treponema sp.]|jgi:metallophosphoesterase (TIGR00282 family)|nr:YmdB family metallophosphoesterase [Treponema sp.]
MARLKVIMIGDVVGEPGLGALEAALPGLIRDHGAEVVVVNGENAAEGFGMTEAVLQRILAAGADVVSSGNHVWEKREFWPVLDAEPRVLRPANYPAGTQGRGWVTFEKAGVSWLVVNLQGREFMPLIDCPFTAFDGLFAHKGEAIMLVDFHAESNREKEALAYYLDGRAGLVAGTHTHVQTADERILPQGTAYITDLGMTGVQGSIIGMDTKICLDRARNQVLYRMECAQGPGAVQGIVVEIDGDTGKALSIRRINAEI